MILCQKVIPLEVDDKGRMVSNTYCMKPAGHDGECAPPKKKKTDAPPKS